VSLIIGLIGGVLGGLVGFGGGVIMIPLMVDFLKMTQHRAHGTSLVAVVFTGLAGAVTYFQNGSVDLTAAGILATAAIFTTRIGARFAHALPEWKLKRSFGAFLLFVSAMMLARPYLPHLESFFPSQEARAVILPASGTLAGFASGMMGVGGGTIMVPAMVLCLGFTQHAANGTSLAAMVVAGSVGAWTHFRLNNVQAGHLIGLVPGVIGGGIIGGMAANHMPEAYLRVLFSAVLIWPGIRNLKADPPRKTAVVAGNAPHGQAIDAERSC